MTTDANEPGNKEDERLTIDDLTPTPIMINPITLRGLIDRLHKTLPTTSEPNLAIIHTIAELDRIARLFEEAERKRQKVWRVAVATASRHMPELLEQLREGSGSVPNELMEKMLAEIVPPEGDDSPPDPNCSCIRCTAKRKRAEQQASSSRTH